MNEKIIYIRATVLAQQEKLLTVRLDDGFGQAQVPVHESNAIPAEKLVDL